MQVRTCALRLGHCHCGTPGVAKCFDRIVVLEMLVQQTALSLEPKNPTKNYWRSYVNSVAKGA